MELYRFAKSFFSLSKHGTDQYPSGNRETPSESGLFYAARMQPGLKKGCVAASLQNGVDVARGVTSGLRHPGA
jgi:hypothetical protein